MRTVFTRAALAPAKRCGSVVCRVVLVAFFLSSLACAPEALPREAPTVEYRTAVIRAERASREAEQAARNVQHEQERAVRLTEEARTLLSRVEAAERRCANSVEKIAQAETSRKKAARAQVVRAHEEKVAAEAVPTPTPEPEKPKEPDYSPSDAPL